VTETTWRKAGSSGTQKGNCVELRLISADRIGVRDSKDVEAGHLVLDVDAFAALVGRIKDGELNL
jgi:hypothetical protein